jgi:hypothetical protein
VELNGFFKVRIEKAYEVKIFLAEGLRTFVSDGVRKRHNPFCLEDDPEQGMAWGGPLG